jgi:hypothetical protein
MNEYEHLKVVLPSSIMQKIKKGQPPTVSNFRFFALRKWLGANKLILRIAKIIIVDSNITNTEKATSKLIELLNSKEGENANSYSSSYGYADDLVELKYAAAYEKEVREGLDGENKSETKQLHEHAEAILTDLISKEKIKTLVNFGVSYAHVDSVLAGRFPDVQFIGIDRSQLTKAFNELHFSHLPNLRFFAGDIFEYLEKNVCEGGVFLHSRTLLFLPNSFIEKLYKAVAKSKYKYIVCIESIGISRQTLRAYEFSDKDQPSVAYRGALIIHNYPGLLRKAGFAVERSELVKNDHFHEDYTYLSITAKRLE